MEIQKLLKNLNLFFAKISEKNDLAEKPLAEDVSQLIRYARHLQSVVDEDYIEECEDYAHLANQLLHAIRRGDASETIPIVDSLQELQLILNEQLG